VACISPRDSVIDALPISEYSEIDKNSALFTKTRAHAGYMLEHGLSPFDRPVRSHDD
jgi:hypothetical protein